MIGCTDLVERFIDAFDARDVERLLALVDEEVRATDEITSAGT